MTMTRTLTTSAFLWTATLGSALAQQTNPAPPIPETGPAGSNSAAANAAATDFNWIWLSLAIAVVALAVWYVARRRQSGNIR
ncbi:MULTISPECIES: hypothetical protein [unclassified Methylobacterium]|uniref:hypothetical protein n=1 Tax=unclassified Methylobacterium TaxID=2615210 RepID=UPI000B2E34A3|nr:MULTISPECIES: hypothetical protein [unclassified Methylobacterium]